MAKQYIHPKVLRGVAAGDFCFQTWTAGDGNVRYELGYVTRDGKGRMTESHFMTISRELYKALQAEARLNRKKYRRSISASIR